MISRLSRIMVWVLLLLFAAAVSAQDNNTPEPGYIYYRVAQGDSLSSIATRYGTTTQTLMDANSIANPNVILWGTVLRIPIDENTVLPTQQPTQSPAPAPAATPGNPPTAAPSPQNTAPAIHLELGGEVSIFDRANEMRKAGMTWAKISLQWQPGDSLDSASQSIEGAHAEGFKLLLEIRGDAAALKADPEGYTADFTAYLQQVSAMQPEAIEVWGDMNTAPISPTAYASLLSAAYESIKRGDSEVMVISGAPDETVGLGDGCEAGSCDELAYLLGMVRAGVAQYADCIGMRYTIGSVPPKATGNDVRGSAFVYYYPTVVSTFAAIFPSKPLCFTGIGYLVPTSATADSAWAADTTLETRAQWIADAAQLAQKTGRIPLFIVYRVDGTASADDLAAEYAITDPDHFCLTCLALSTTMQP